MRSGSAQTYLTRASNRTSLPQNIIWRKFCTEASFLKICLNTEKEQIQGIIFNILFHLDNPNTKAEKN